MTIRTVRTTECAQGAEAAVAPGEFLIDLGSDGSCMVYWRVDGVRTGVGYSRGAGPEMWREALLDKGVASDDVERIVERLPEQSVGLRAQLGWKL